MADSFAEDLRLFAKSQTNEGVVITTDVRLIPWSK